LVNLSIDLIFGIPRRVGRSWSYDLDQALRLEVPHLSLYGLTVEPGTPLGRAVGEGREQPVDEGQYRDEYLEAAERLVGAGYVHYEVSNFARPGAESRHNRVYWSGEPYLGLGNSAHSHAWPLRRWNLRQWDEYEEAAGAGRLPVAEGEVLDDAATRLEAVWLKLRTREGHPAQGLSRRVRDLVDGWARQGWAVASSSSVQLTREGWLLLDRLAVEMDSLLERET
jgi:oxygen-independent coproporphyrinogen-3 oxidase